MVRWTARALQLARGAPLPYPKNLAFAFDIDGVLKQGPKVLPQAKRVMQLLTASNGILPKPVPFLLMTNGGGVPDAARRKLLSKDMGVELVPNQLVQSHTPLASLVHTYADKPVLVVGGASDSARKVAESYGLNKAIIPQDIMAWNPTIWDRYHPLPEDEHIVRRDLDLSQPIAAIFVLHDSHDWGRDLTLINELMQSDNGVLGTIRANRHEVNSKLPLYFTNPDLEWKSDYPVVRLGMGAFSLAVRSVYHAATGLELPFTQLGKPYAMTYDFADKMLRDRAGELGESEELRVYMVGDNPLSDIWGANDHGWQSILLRTGVWDGSAPPTHAPTHIAADVEEAVNWAIERELRAQQ